MTFRIYNRSSSFSPPSSPPSYSSILSFSHLLFRNIPHTLSFLFAILLLDLPLWLAFASSLFPFLPLLFPSARSLPFESSPLYVFCKLLQPRIPRLLFFLIANYVRHNRRNTVMVANPLSIASSFMLLAPLSPDLSFAGKRVTFRDLRRYRSRSLSLDVTRLRVTISSCRRRRHRCQRGSLFFLITSANRQCGYCTS